MARTPEQIKQAAVDAEAWLDTLDPEDVPGQDAAPLRAIAEAVSAYARATAIFVVPSTPPVMPGSAGTSSPRCSVHPARPPLSGTGRRASWYAGKIGTPPGTRTPNPLIKSQML